MNDNDSAFLFLQRLPSSFTFTSAKFISNTLVHFQHYWYFLFLVCRRYFSDFLFLSFLSFFFSSSYIMIPLFVFFLISSTTFFSTEDCYNKFLMIIVFFIVNNIICITKLGDTIKIAIVKK